MAGLLDFGETEEEKSANRGLLAAMAGMGILGSMGQNTTPAQAFGQGGIAGLNAFSQQQQLQQQQKQQQMMNQFRQLQMQKMQYDMNKPMSPKDRYTNVPGVGLVDLTASGGPSVAMPAGKDPAKDPEIVRTAQYLFPNDPERQRSYIERVQTKPLVDMRDNQADRGLIDMDLDRLKGVNGEVMKLRSNVPKLELIESALNKFPTGLGGSELLSFKQAAQRLGFKAEGAAEGELIQSIVSELAPQMRAAGSGSSSDLDVDMFVKSLPNLTRTPEGNRLVIATARTLLERKQAESEFMRDYFRENNNSLKGYEKAMDAKLGPVFPRPKSPDDVASLRPGTLFMTPDGDLRVKK